ncbi:MAG: hypothetical protein EX263_07100 [Flavobacteriaceae bacterium]|nr:MAG: hypothetical protein EX263_07100 [Flavobacteriaceae bacterium]
MKTNRIVLYKGLRIMALTLVLMFIGPFLMYVAFSNQEKPLYIPILILSFIVCGAAIFFGFKGIQTIMNSMFKNANSN